MARHLLSLAVAAVLLVGCTADTDPDPAGEEPSTTADVTEPSDDDPGEADEDVDPPIEEPPCRLDTLEVGQLELTGPDAVEVAVRVTERTHRCAPVVVVAADDPWVASLAAAVASAADVPLLLADPAAPEVLAPTLSRLDVEELVTVGLELAAFGLPGTELLAPTDRPDVDADVASDLLGLTLRVAEHLGTDRFLAVPVEDADARAAALTRLEPQLALLPLPGDLGPFVDALPPTARLEVLAGDGAVALAERLTGLGLDAEVVGDDDLWARAADAIDVGAMTWLVDPADGLATAVASVAAAGRGEALLPVDGEDLRAGREGTDRLRAAQLGDVVLVGQVTDEADWQLATVLEGEPLPGGGFRLFEDERMVALYGSVETSVLGVLGEQGLDAAVDRARTVAEPYGADGARVLPAFEIITTIASATAQPTGDYSRRTPIEVLRPWVDRAAEEGLYVFLDLQPGRTDFLTQAREYEELLREPHVGLALDPEWRLAPDEVHLQQIGSVAAAEVQEVADWLAALTREHRLPEKLLVLHQFRFSMLPDRDTIVAPPELAVVVHMDGQGTLAQKYETYAAITGGVEDRWLWGWKNFYDEDSPTATPSQVLDLVPLPVLVTYQ
ncbi:MAG: hypothetical protein ACNA8R_08500 [Nitriliruptoraceae bacterium]